MLNVALLLLPRLVILSFALGVCALPVSSARAQMPFGVGGDNPESDNSRTPFRIKLSGFINTRPEEGSVAVTLRINTYRETYQFEVVSAEAVDNPRVSQNAILQQVGKYPVDFHLIGPNELLSKVAQSQPGTPLAIVGMFQQRGRNLQLLSVEVIGMTNYEEGKRAQ
jgi:hypothetical protein